MWRNRETLSQGEWEECYQRVMAVLANYRPREAASLGGALHDLHHQFFVERVMPGEGRGGHGAPAAPEHGDELRLTFRRFLLDLQRHSREGVMAPAAIGTSTLLPPLNIVAARLDAGNTAKIADEGPLPALQANGASAAGGVDWTTRPIPDALAAAFARASQASPQRARALAPGQYHALRHAPGFGAVLLDRWSPAGQCWQGWLVTPDSAYAGSTDMVLEDRDGPLDPRIGMVCCAIRVLARADQLGTCLGVLADERLGAVRWLGEQDRGAGNLARPGTVARFDVPGGYALTGSPLAGPSDPRHAYRDLLARGVASFGLEPAQSVLRGGEQDSTQRVVASKPGSGSKSRSNSSSSSSTDKVKQKERPIPQPPSPAGTTNGARWVKPFAIVAAMLALLQFGLLAGSYNRDNAAMAAPSRSAPPQGGSGSSSDLHARFRPEATEAEIRTWLLREGLQIVGGPDATGGFTLHGGDAQHTLPAPGPGNPLARVGP
ncbi:hypothetical protein CS8_008550 [Cupriavidus sp. 8B]